MLVSRREEEEVEVRSMNRDWGALRQGEKSLLAS